MGRMRNAFSWSDKFFGTNFAATLRKPKSSVKIEGTEPTLMSCSSASSWTVIRQSFIAKSRTSSITSSFRLVDGLPERTSLSTEERPSLNRLYHFFICVTPITSSLKARWILSLSIAKFLAKLNAIITLFQTFCHFVEHRNTTSTNDTVFCLAGNTKVTRF